MNENTPTSFPHFLSLPLCMPRSSPALFPACLPPLCSFSSVFLFLLFV